MRTKAKMTYEQAEYIGGCIQEYLRRKTKLRVAVRVQYTSKPRAERGIYMGYRFRFRNREFGDYGRTLKWNSEILVKAAAEMAKKIDKTLKRHKLR